MKNIALIGMPGSGKSSLGKMLAAALKMDFDDTDDIIVSSEGKSIAAIFSEQGEDYFRDCESRAVGKAAGYDSAVIATGGGVVLREANVRALRKSCVIVYIDRPVELILKNTDLSGRPLLKGNERRIYELYETRSPLYEKYADVRVENAGGAPEVVSEIIDALNGLEEKQ